jgi:hypothetical protein
MPIQADKVKIRKEYIAWCATPQRLRVQLDLPKTKREFAELKGINEKTLQRWQNLPEHKEMVEQHKRKFAGNIENSSITRQIKKPMPETHGNALKKYQDPPTVTLEDDPVWNPTLGPDEQRYLKVKDTLVNMASDGHSQAIDMYLKHWGKPFIEAEQSSVGMFPNLSDNELTERILSLLGKERISEFLSYQASLK